MNVQDYRAAGYALSQLIEQAVVTRAENDVIAAYIVPLFGHVPSKDEREAEPLKTAIMVLSFLLIQQRSSTATRAGAKLKMSEQSTTPTYDDLLRQHAPTCVNALRAIAPDAHKKVSDICRVFFTTNYFYQH